MQASPSALNTPQRTSFDVPTPLKIKRAPILGARKKGKAQKNLRTQLSTKSRPTFFFCRRLFSTSNDLEVFFSFERCSTARPCAEKTSMQLGMLAFTEAFMSFQHQVLRTYTFQKFFFLNLIIVAWIAFLAQPFFSSTSSGAFFSSLVLAHQRCAHSFSASQLGELVLIEDWH